MMMAVICTALNLVKCVIIISACVPILLVAYSIVVIFAACVFAQETAKGIWTPKIENDGRAQSRSPIKEETSDLPAINRENRTKILIVNVHEQKYSIVFNHYKQRVINTHLENSFSSACCCDCKNIFFHSQQKMLMTYIGESSSSQTSEDDQEI